ncbi:MAG TPA: multidrug efflux RND transporter permease subunit [Pirellulales bacterium]|jgi:multidrug efflux pump|nr:multidrug efflux RND transporter permease subunit [Pirellulales bacterium]
MSLSTPFIHRPVGTTLLTIAITLAGVLGFLLLPVSPLPEVDFPTIQVQAALPGASPETMASAVAAPLERQFGNIAGITEMTSTSSLGASTIVMQFDLNRNIDAAARDVQAKINAARGRLPPNLPSNPTYRKVNPADAPILILALTSDTYDTARMYDAASTILSQKLSQVQGVGQVIVGGGAPPAVRIDVNPTILNHFGIGLDDVRNAVGAANINSPKGQIADATRAWSIGANDQLLEAKDYAPLIVAYRNGAPVRVADVSKVTDSVEDIRNFGLSDGKPAIMIIVFRQPGANIIDTVDRVLDLLPQLEAEIPAGIDLAVANDRTATIRASVEDVEFTLCVSIGLVILVVFIFLRNGRATFIPSVAVPVSLIATFGVMYLCNYSLDNLSLMALTIATGFVVDDAIVVIENIDRHLEEGRTPLEAALIGAKEIGFTVLSISVSLVAVFIPILMMGGLVGRLFREFAVTLSVAIGVSMLVSLTTTPMMCAKLLKSKHEERHGPLYRASERIFNLILSTYEKTLSVVLRFRFLTLMVTIGTLVFTIYLYVVVPKGFFPQQDTGRLSANLVADQDTSFQAMKHLLVRFTNAVSQDPAVDGVIGFTGGQNNSAYNMGRMFITLKPLGERDGSADEIIRRLSSRTASIPGATLYPQATQDLRIGGKSSSAQYQYTLQSDNLDDLKRWGPRMLTEMRQIDGLRAVNSDQQDKGRQTDLTIDRVMASRLGISPQAIDDTLYDAFGQRQVSTMYKPLNQYHVVMEVEPRFWQNPDSLRYIYIEAAGGLQVPLSAICRFASDTTPLAVNHAGQFSAVTISFNLRPGFSLGEAVEKIEGAAHRIGLPSTMRGTFLGTAQAFQASLKNEPLLILAALAAVYIVLGILYESYIHPITILSTLPSAGVGALLALMLCGMELNVMGLIGIILLIGIVKKNAIMMIDFALEAERRHGKSPRDAIFEACVLRFRPITMTTMAALLGGLPLALGTGNGSELRRPLGVAIVGGLIFSQMLTLYTTPVVYLYLDRFRLQWARWRGHRLPEDHMPEEMMKAE